MNDKKVNKQFVSEGKLLISFYITLETLDQMDNLYYVVKKKLPIERRRKLTKSIFYETGFKLILEDNQVPENNQAQEEDSELVKAIQEFIQSL